MLFFGMIRPYKGVPHLLDAWAQMPAADRRGATLLIVGDASDPEYRARIARQAADTPDTRLDLRFVENGEIPVLMGAADLLVLPFQASLTSGTVRLAEDYSLPVVVPRTTGTAEARNAILARDTGPESLGRAIAQALSQTPDHPTHAPAVTWSQIAQAHHGVYRNVCREAAS